MNLGCLKNVRGSIFSMKALHIQYKNVSISSDDKLVFIETFNGAIPVYVMVDGNTFLVSQSKDSYKITPINKAFPAMNMFIAPSGKTLSSAIGKVDGKNVLFVSLSKFNGYNLILQGTSRRNNCREIIATIAKKTLS